MNGGIVCTLTLGVLGGETPVTVSLGVITPDMLTINKVLLSQNYAMQAPYGFLARPPAGAALIQGPTTYASGETIYVFSFESAAIVAAGGGTITGTGYP